MEHPRTHKARPDLGRAETDPDVLEVALQLRNMLSNEEIWYVIQTWKNEVVANAKKEAHEEDNSSNCDEPYQHPWGDIGGIAFSEKELPLVPGCLLGSG